jgi:hypothetical protein
MVRAGVFDLFHYYNTDRPDAPSGNCEPHVDRDFLSAVWSPVDGLQLWSRTRARWESPANQRLLCGQCASASASSLANDEIITVFVNSAMETLCRMLDSAKPIPACVHRVGEACSPRLSLSYELRQPPGLSPTDWIHRLRGADGDRDGTMQQLRYGEAEVRPK